MKKGIVLLSLLTMTTASAFANETVHTYAAGPFKTVSMEASVDGTSAELVKLFEDGQFEAIQSESNGAVRKDYQYKQIKAHVTDRNGILEYGAEFHMEPGNGSAVVHRNADVIRVQLEGKLARDLFLIMARADLPIEYQGEKEIVRGKSIECSYQYLNGGHFLCDVVSNDSL